MGTPVRVAVALALLLSCAACGELRGSHFGWGSFKAIDQYFIGTEPYDFSGPDANDPGLREAAAALLTNRRVNYVSNSLEATSYISYSHLLYQGLSQVGSTTHYRGSVVYGVPDDPGVLIFRFYHDLSYAPAETTIQYVLDQAATEAMLAGVRDWNGRVGEYYQSENTQAVEATLRGEQDGEPWELRCKQDFSCQAYASEVI